MNNLTQTSQF